MILFRTVNNNEKGGSSVTTLVVVLITMGLLILFFGVRHLSDKDRHRSEELPEATDKLEVIDTTGSGRDYDCGHIGPESFVVHFYGLETKPVDDGKRCPECFIEELDSEIIRCCLCRLPIFPSNPIALYAGAEGLQKDIATKHDGQWVGCLRWHCCPSAAAFAGYWTGESIETVFGGNTAAAETVKTGKPVAGSPQKGTVRTLDTEEDTDEGC